MWNVGKLKYAVWGSACKISHKTPHNLFAHWLTECEKHIRDLRGERRGWQRHDVEGPGSWIPELLLGLGPAT